MTTVACISAEDSRQIAGLAADLRTLRQLAGQAIAVSCGRTEQDAAGKVEAIAPAEAAALGKELVGVRADAVKIGALLSAELAATVGEWAKNLSCPLVLDPVLAASGGGLPLLDDGGRHLLLGELLPMASLITPNFGEGERLSGARSAEAMAEELLKRGAKAVLIKGGHMRRQKGFYGDFLATGDRKLWLKSEFLDKTCRATGCSLATAIAFYLGGGLPLVTAVKKARKLVWRGIKESRSGVIWEKQHTACRREL